MRISKRRAIVWGLLFLYAIAGISFLALIQEGTLERNQRGEAEKALSGVEANLEAAHLYVGTQLVRGDGFVRLYATPDGTPFPGHNQTNSEALSYHLYVSARTADKETFDWLLDFLEAHMLHPKTGHMMWRLEENLSAVGDGSNMASDAELRTLKALLIAEERWGDERYSTMIDTLAAAVERMAVTPDGLLAPYAGPSGDDVWTAREVWLSYEDFTVFSALAERRGDPWDSLFENMKRATLQAQIPVGLYNPELTVEREQGTAIDGGGYGINSLWIMVRAAESGDQALRASANRTLQLYRERYFVDAELYATYSSSGDPLSAHDAAWVYALVGRAAVALGDKEFGRQMVEELISRQVLDQESPLYGAIPEGGERDLRVGQFTMHEAIITMEDYVELIGGEFELRSSAIEQLWQDRGPVVVEDEEVPEVLEVPTPMPEQNVSIATTYLSKAEESEYYSYQVLDPQYGDVAFFIRGELVKVIAEEYLFEVREDRTLKRSNVIKPSEQIFRGIKDGELRYANYLWWNRSNDVTHGCYVPMEGDFSRDGVVQAVRENCQRLSNRPFPIIHRFVRYQGRPPLPEEWLLSYLDAVPLRVERGHQLRDPDEETVYAVDLVTYENEDGTSTTLWVHAGHGLPVRADISRGGKVEQRWEYRFFRVNDPSIRRWHPEFLRE